MLLSLNMHSRLVQSFLSLFQQSIRQVTIRTNAPKRSGEYDGSGAYCECNFPAVRGVTKSIINAIIQNIKRISKTGMKAATTQITIERENPSMNRLIK